MPLWIDKYRPKKVQDLDVNPDQRTMLQTMLKNSDCNIPHLLVYGPSGSGKKTRIDAILRAIYGSAVDKKKFEKKNFTTPSNKKIEIDCTSSNYHLEVNPSDANIADRFVVQELIKHVAASPSVATIQSQKNNISFKTIIIYEADRLTRDAQHALRRTMEKHMNKCRCVLIAKSTSRIIEPLVSRCLPIKCRAATHEELLNTVYPPVRREWYQNQPSEAVMKEIVRHADRDMRKFLLLLEVYKVTVDSSNGKWHGQIDKILPDWEIFIKRLVGEIKKVANVNEIPNIRKSLYELISHLIPNNVIFTHLLEGLIEDKPLILKQALIDAAAKFEHRSRNGSKEIYHLEGFVVEYLAVTSEYNQTGKIGNFDLA